MNKIVLTLAVTLLLSACGEGFLELTPPSDLNVNIFYKTAADMDVAVNAAYASLKDRGQWTGYSQLMPYYGDVHSDVSEVFLNTDARGLESFDISTSPGNFDAFAGTMWNNAYQGIMRCNVVMDKIGDVTMDEALKERYVGEVKFVRALWYFAMVRLFGDVPLVTAFINEEEAYQMKRAPAAEVYQQIIRDLSDAAGVLPEKSRYTPAQMGRVTSGAARSLLGKVYLTMHNYTAAATELAAVINSGEYSLQSDYNKIFGPANENNQESIFEVQHQALIGVGSRFVNDFAPRNSGNIITGIGEGLGRNIPTLEMLEAFEEGDLRKDISVSAGYYSEQGDFVSSPYTRKYLAPMVEAYLSDVNYIVLRYADVLLMYAEALNETNQGPDATAYASVNAIRKRAGLKDLPTGMTRQSFALAVEQERKVELAFEGHRWFDLVRTGRAVTVMNQHFKNREQTVVVKDFQLLLPVPQDVIDVSEGVIDQNLGW